ncbi:hypothetical protein [Kaistia terrae]|uniref:Uncharacterized protein n=1 Tax=Kaistia terrae TaxID=537017 RepID=A0ABW0Q160_9HYPH|nr:hypothetical protein [Kaistia terrae]MCX5580254.1 hypothetical protein [Kaistia terrae]
MSEQTSDVSHLIQPLDWTMDRDGDASAYTPFGSYRVTFVEGLGWRWGYCFSEYYDDDDFGCSCRKAGMDAAWANWVKRVSPILTLPVPPAVAKEGT